MSAWQTAKSAVNARFFSQVVSSYSYKTTPEINGKITVAVDGTDNQYEDATEDLSVFSKSQRIIVSGFTTSANNGLFTVKKESVSANALPVAETALEDQAAGDTVTIQTALPVQLENDITFVKPDDLWVRVSHHSIADTLLDVGASNTHQYVGDAWFELYARLGDGTKVLNDLADTIYGAFYNSTTNKPVTASGVRYRLPQMVEMGTDSDFHRIDVHVNFEYDY